MNKIQNLVAVGTCGVYYIFSIDSFTP